MIDDPIQIVGVGWNNGELTIKLNHAVNQTWIWALLNMGGHQSLIGKSPHHFDFRGNEAKIPAREGEVQDAINYFRGWLPRTNEVYKHKIQRDKENKEQLEKQALRKKIQEKETHIRVNRNLRF